MDKTAHVGSDDPSDVEIIVNQVPMPLHCIEYSPAQPSPAQPAREVIRKERKRRSKAECRSRERGLPNKSEKCLRARKEAEQCFAVGKTTQVLRTD